MEQNYAKRLIEVDMPIRRVSAHARREKNINSGHISTLHTWWARRPLAACRAVLCAALWFDPCDALCPAAFRALARETMCELANNNLRMFSAESLRHFSDVKRDSSLLVEDEFLRSLLLDFIADFANWDNSTSQDFLDAARFLTHVAHLALTENLEFQEGFAEYENDHSMENLKSKIESLPKPLVVDPFAGGGAIPLEALRVGADAFASDLNPIAVLLNKVVLEYIPKYGGRLATAVREYGELIKNLAKIELGEFYPANEGQTPVAYLWARTIKCEGPSCGANLPMLRTLKLSKNQNLNLVLDKSNKTIEFEINSNDRKIGEGTVRSGAAVCPFCGFTTKAGNVKQQLIAQRGGANKSRLIAVYVKQNGSRKFRLPNDLDFSAFQKAKEVLKNKLIQDPNLVPNEEINPIRPYKNTRGLSAVTRIGCLSFGDLYNYRQLLTISTFYQILGNLEIKDEKLEPNFVTALKSLLALAINRSVYQNTSVSRWDSSRSTIKGAFSKQALQIIWDFAEANPFSGGTADWDSSLDWILKFMNACSQINTAGSAIQSSATEQVVASGSASAIFTDPPYFSAIPYADLSDFFYVWLNRGIKHSHPDLFGTPLTKKGNELIVTNAQLTDDGKAKDEEYFKSNMALALKTARESIEANGIGVIVYAEGTTSGWEAMLAAIIDAGWVVSSSWAIDTEMSNRTQAQGAASLQSSVHIVCRPRVSKEVGDYGQVLLELPRRIHEWLPRLANEGIVGADAIFACLGPALEIFSRYECVERTNGKTVGLREYLELVWAAVAKEALSMIFAGADASGFEPDARITAMWLWTLSTAKDRTDLESRVINAMNPDEELDAEDEEEETSSGKKKVKGFVLEYDAARKIAQGLGVNLDAMDICEVKGDTARLLPVKERTRQLFGAATDENATTAAATRSRRKSQISLFDEMEEAMTATVSGWHLADETRRGATVLDRLHQAMIFFAAGRGEALRRFLVDDGVGADERFWRLANALSALYPKSSEEKRWVDGILAKKKGLGF